MTTTKHHNEQNPTRWTTSRPGLAVQFWNMPPEVENVIRLYTGDIATLLPEWVGLAAFFFGNDANGAAASCTSSLHYARHRIDLTGSWLSNDPQTRRSMLVHELMHAHVYPLQEYALSLLTLIGEQDVDVMALLKEELMQRVEMATTSLERLADRLTQQVEQ